MPRYRRRRLELWRLERQIRDNGATWAAVAIPLVVLVVVLVMVWMQR